MKILHVITSLTTGGAEKLMVDLLPRLRDLGNDVELVIFNGRETPFKKQLREQHIIIHSLSYTRNVYHWQNLWRLRKYINKFDIVHTHNTAPQLFAAIDSVGKKVKLCTTEHNTTNRRRDKKILYWGDKWMYAQYDKIICISDQAEINLRQYLQNDSSKITTIYNGIDLDLFKNASPNYQLKPHQDKTIITMVSAFRPQKDHETLIKSMKLLPPQFELWLVGDGETLEEMKMLSRKEKLTERIVFWGRRNDIPTILKTSDIIVMSSHYEGLSLSNLEGMSCGRPFIASDVDGLREIVQGYGILFPHKNKEALAQEILHLSEDNEYAERIVHQCILKTSNYDISIMATKYNEIYNNLV